MFFIFILIFFLILFNIVGAIQAATAEFIARDVGNSRVLILISDGQAYGASSTDICGEAETMKSEDIITYTIGVSDKFDSHKLDCLSETSDYSSYVTTLDSFDSSYLDSTILGDISDVTCLKQPNLQITEVKTSSSGSRFIEVYNHGYDIDLSTLDFEGLFQGSVVSTSNTLKQGQRMVIYDLSSGYPDCGSCSCSINATSPSNWCSNVKYFACGSGKPCNYASITPNWYQTIGTTSETYESLTYDSSTWPALPTGYSWELKNTGFDNSLGFNWKQSCDSEGSPGQSPYDCTSWDCSGDVSDCTRNGASLATCGPSS